METFRTRWVRCGTSVAAIVAAVLWNAPAAAHAPRLFNRDVRLDDAGKILAWPTNGAPYEVVSRLAWHALETKFRPQDNGLYTWLGYARFDPTTFDGIAWPHNPAGLYAMLTDSALLWYAFSGDHACVDLARTALRYQLDHGTTPGDWSWSRVPYASAGAGDLDYRGADDTWCNLCGRGDGIGVIEPDKVGELGFAYLQMYELTGDVAFRDGALACADALASHVREGDKRMSPWPFRVRAQTNVAREEYTSNVIGPVVLFEELERSSIGNVSAYARARTIAVRWMFQVPMVDDAWSGYFEDVDIHGAPTDDLNQYSALRTARWLLSHRDLDRHWLQHVRHLLAWTADHFGRDTGTERGTQWGATVLSEQSDDMSKMASHTARYGAVLALWYEATGDTMSRARAERSLNWATYACRDDGIVAVSENPNEGWWFSDGYGDFIRYFLMAMAAVPTWAPADQDHLLRSSSTVTQVAYEARRVTWRTYDPDASEVLRLTFQPTRVLAGGRALTLRPQGNNAEGFDVQPLGMSFLVHVRHMASHDVEITGETPETLRMTNLAGSAPPKRPTGHARTFAAFGFLAMLGGAVALTTGRRRRRREQAQTSQRVDFD